MASDSQAEKEGIEVAASISEPLFAIKVGISYRQPDLAVPYIHSFSSLADTGQGIEVQKQLNEMYDEVVPRDRLDPIINPFDSGVLAFVLLFAGILTLAVGLVLMARYRCSIARWMKAASRNDSIQSPALSPSSTNMPGEFPLHTVDAWTLTQRTAYHSKLIEHSARAYRHAAWVYGGAGLAFASVAAALEFPLSSIDFSFFRAVVTAWAWAWPVVLMLGILWGPDRQRLTLALLVYFGVLFGFCAAVALSETPALELGGMIVAPFFQPLALWLITAVPTAYLLLFLLRGIRTIGPVLLVFMVIIGFGAAVATALESTSAGVAALSVPMAALELSPPVVDGTVKLLGIMLFAPFGWKAIQHTGQRYRKHHFSDQMLVFNSIWLFQTLFVVNHLANRPGLWAWTGVGAFVVYRLITWSGLKILGAALSPHTPARLLLLRVFRFRRRTERLFDLLSARWRYAGPIRLIAAPDLASRSIDADKFLDFLSGRLRHRFIIEPSDLDCRIAEMDPRPDPDGRYRIHEHFCGKDTWELAVKRLMAESDLIIMDLRTFSPKNQGCIFELQSLIDIVPIACVILLIDDTTDVTCLRTALAERWREIRSTSPNRKPIGSLTLLHAGRRHGAVVVQALLAIADDRLARTALVTK